MLTGLAHGVREIYPVLSVEEAMALRDKMPDALLGGERHGERIAGFDVGNSPLEYRTLGPVRIITTTTNGTVALRACAHAKEVLAGGLLNAQALKRRLEDKEKILLVCAGTFRDPALEDMLAGGLLAACFGGAILSDAALTLRALWQRYEKDLYSGLSASRNGQVLLAKGREAEVRWCAQESLLDVVGVLRGSALVAAD